MHRLSFILILLLAGCTPARQPTGSYLGLLQFPDITYHIYLNWSKKLPVVTNTTFKAEEFSLDTLYFVADSLRFQLHDFYSEYKGKWNPDKNQIDGVWIGEDSVHYPLTFIPVSADTVSGLHPRITKNYVYQIPPQELDDITTCPRARQQMNELVLDSVVQHIMDGCYANVHSLLIARNNCLVVEEYFYRYDRNFVYNIQSATKSIVSALTGIAIDKGEIKNVSETLCGNLPGYEAAACKDQNKDITLHQLLTMSTGIAWDEQTYDYIDPRNTLSIAANEQDQFVHLRSLPRNTSDAPCIYLQLTQPYSNECGIAPCHEA
jgi:Beta-lactamase